MSEHPIQSLMTTAMESIKEMVDVNTIVGDAVQAPDGTVIIPISRVAFGFAAGGGEYSQPVGKKSDSGEDEREGSRKSDKFPFAGGSGAGVSINPVAFMVVGNGHIKLLPVNINSSVDKILDLVPEIWKKATDTINKKITIKKEIKTGESAVKDDSDKKKSDD